SEYLEPFACSSHVIILLHRWTSVYAWGTDQRLCLCDTVCKFPFPVYAHPSFDFEKFKRFILCVRVSIRTSTTVLRPALKMSRCRHFYPVPCIGGHLEFETMLDPRFGQEVATFHH